jgi:hypothetical protein
MNTDHNVYYQLNTILILYFFLFQELIFLHFILDVHSLYVEILIKFDLQFRSKKFTNIGGFIKHKI